MTRISSTKTTASPAESRDPQISRSSTCSATNSFSSKSGVQFTTDNSKSGSKLFPNDSPKMLRQLLSGADRNRVRNSSDLLSQVCNQNTAINNSGGRFDTYQQASPNVSPGSTCSSPNLKNTQSHRASLTDNLESKRSSLCAQSDSVTQKKVDQLMESLRCLREGGFTRNSREIAEESISNLSLALESNTVYSHSSVVRPRSETLPNMKTAQGEQLKQRNICVESDSLTQESLLAQLVIQSDDYDRPPNCKMKASMEDNVYRRKKSITHHLWPLTSVIKIEDDTLRQTQMRILEMLEEIQQTLVTLNDQITPDLLLAVVADYQSKLSQIESKLLRFLQRVWAPLLVLYAAKNNFQFLFSPMSQPASEYLTSGPKMHAPTLAFAQNLVEFIQQGHSMNVSNEIFEAVCHLVLTQTAYPDFCLVSYSGATSRLKARVVQDSQNSDILFTELLLMINRLNCFDDVTLRSLFQLHTCYPSPLLIQNRHCSMSTGIIDPNELQCLATEFCQRNHGASIPENSSTTLAQFLTQLGANSSHDTGREKMNFLNPAQFINCPSTKAIKPPDVSNSNAQWPCTDDDLRTVDSIIALLGQLTTPGDQLSILLKAFLENGLNGTSQELNESSRPKHVDLLLNSPYQSFDTTICNASRKRKAQIGDHNCRQRSATFTNGLNM